jgi:twinkle protein
LLLAKAYFDDWKIGVFSPEDFPADEFYDDLIHMLVGKSTDAYDKHVMERAEYNDAIDVIKKHFFYVYPEKDFSWESIEAKMLYLVRKQGIKSIILDPYNQFDHQIGSGREDLYISKFMAKLKRFAILNDVSIHLVAHQTTPIYIAGQDYPQPNAYKIKGGGTFADKADNVIFIWRKYRCTDPTNPSVIFGADKIKKQRLVGQLGQKEFVFNYLENRYYLDDKNPFRTIKMKQSDAFDNASQKPNEDFLSQGAPIFFAPVDDKDDVPF